ncbi:hypothetical protein CHH83_18360 [Bacillus sp. 7586-K]|uniref:Uncharacterized protein n=1 Tax=Metabacillus niabensis TaxID=324854 RepID=A0ABT9Z0Q7_9BACI|nr:hypothetical protein [Metabacillus niabensis]MDQ0225782.1 hypothetical protein [Metabacillus niabensis]PAD67519.1 hypothetical protein CHH83_18360 [Bacillus sp. 7586-K]
MKVKALIEQLQKLDQETEVRISLRKGLRPIGTKPIKSLEPVIDQDTNRLGFYVIDVNTEFGTEEESKSSAIESNNEDIPS